MMTRPEKNDEPGSAETYDNIGEELAKAVGREIRSLRLSLLLSAGELAASSGISNGMLSKIEHGTATPSLASLAAISRALKVPTARLFASSDQRADYSLVRAGRGILVRRKASKSGFSFELLGHLLSGEKFVEPYLVTVTNEAAPSPGFQHTGIQAIYMLEGQMSFRYADEVVDLSPGDTLVFDGNGIHGHESLTIAPARYLSFIFNLRG